MEMPSGHLVVLGTSILVSYPANRPICTCWRPPSDAASRTVSNWRWTLPSSLARLLRMQIKPFRIEQYFGKYEFTARYLLSSSDAESRTIKELLDLEPGAHERFLEHWCGYTESPGAPWLREAIAAIYQRVKSGDVLVLAAAEEGIFVLYHALVGPGDHVIVETPCYESGLEVARSTGAQVSEWRRTFEKSLHSPPAATSSSFLTRSTASSSTIPPRAFPLPAKRTNAASASAP